MSGKHAKYLLDSNPSIGKPISLHKMAYWVKVPQELMQDVVSFDQMIATYRRRSAMRRRKAELMARRWQ